MKRNVSKIILTIIALSLIMNSLVGCSNREATPTTAPEAFNNNESPSVDIDVDKLIGESIEISPEKEDELKAIFAHTYNLNKDEFIIEVKGEFDGAYAVGVIVTTPRASLPPDISEIIVDGSEIVNGYEFAYINVVPLKIVYEGACYSLSEAVAKGLLNNLNLETLFWRCKKKNNTTLEDNFSEHVILMTMMPSYNFKEYTPEDFSDLNCVEVRDLSVKLKEGEICKILSIDIEENGKQAVLDAIRVLEKRRDVFGVYPNSYLTVDPSPVGNPPPASDKDTEQ